MRRAPGFALTAVLILALGISANVIVFGVLQAMILQPLNVPHPDRVKTFAPHQADYPVFSWPEVRDVRDGNTVFSAVAGDDDRRKKDAVFPIVRLKDGVTVEQAQAEMNTLASRIQRQDPKNEDGLQFWLAPPGLIGDFVGGPARRFLFGIMVLAGILLLAACANPGGLFAARTADRSREIAIRLAVGSSRWRILRQVLIEAFVISILGGACAGVLSWTTLGALAHWQPPSDYPIKFEVVPHPSLILVAFLISVMAGILFGVMPLRQIFKADPNDAIKSSSQATTGRRWALRDFLLAGQIALCCVTVTAAFAALRGLLREQ